MAEPFDRIASDTELLSERVRELERRVSVLENMPTRTIPSLTVSARVEAPKSSAPQTLRAFPGASVPTGTLPLFGKAVLGISGAYLLRAVAESGALPQWPILIFAIGYAYLWLVWAVRTRTTNTLASVTYAITATTILCPLLWESTVRFQILWPPFTAAVLVAFPMLAWALAWREDLQAIPWVTTVAAVATALALSIATRDLFPFTAGLLVLALVAEAIDFRHRLSIRVVPAVAADFALWLLIYVMTLPEESVRVSAHRFNGNHRVMSGDACDLRGKHWHAQSRVAPASDDLRGSAGRYGFCACDFRYYALQSWLRRSARSFIPAACDAVLLGHAISLRGRRAHFGSPGVREFCGRTSADRQLSRLSLKPADVFLVCGRTYRVFLIHAHWQAQPRLTRVPLSDSGGDILWPLAFGRGCSGRTGASGSGRSRVGSRGLGRSLLRNRFACFD